MCDKSRGPWVHSHRHWTTTKWCQLNALPASPVVHLVSPLSWVSVSMDTQCRYGNKNPFGDVMLRICTTAGVWLNKTTFVYVWWGNSCTRYLIRQYRQWFFFQVLLSDICKSTLISVSSPPCTYLHTCICICLCACVLCTLVGAFGLKAIQ